MILLSGTEISATVKAEIKINSNKFFLNTGRKPALAVILAGENPASLTYVKNKKKSCEEVDFDHIDIVFNSSVSQKEVLECIERLNNDRNIDGILVQLPLPPQIDENAVINAIIPEKDVDGFTLSNIGKLLLGQPGFVACTPKGILRMLDFYGISTEEKDVCIVGRSNIVGKPLAALLMQRNRNATVTICHSHTKDIKSNVSKADIVISATGQLNLITADMVKEGAVVIDVGINRVPDSSKKSGFCLKGDVDFESLKSKVYAITPVPGGVGPMTITMLLENTLLAAVCRNGLKPEDYGVKF